tara:strand:+ start:3714 stop:4160 length:447 start_codon:yes stop_codon:yes gene_type:complete
MIKVKDINFEELKIAIKNVFIDDKKILDFYDPSVKIKNIEDIINDISCKIKDYDKYEGDYGYVGLFYEKVLIGYYFYKEDMLVSFGINVKYRTKKYLDFLFNSIMNKLGNNFVCFLWLKNTRAAKWLIKNKMVIEFKNDKIIKLKLCQ